MTKSRAWQLEKVLSHVNCSSTGHHFFSVYVNHNGRRHWIDYCLETGAEITLPKYMVAAIEERIGFMGPEAFTVFEYDQDRNERYENLRYHDAECFAKTVRALYPLPF